MKLSDERISELWLSRLGMAHRFARAIELEAYRNGQEAMRERAANVCTKPVTGGLRAYNRAILSLGLEAIK